MLEKEKKIEEENKHVDKIIFDDDYILESDLSSDDEEEIKQASRMFLPEEDQEKIVETIEQDKNREIVESTERWNQEFFRSGSKSIRQPGLVSRELGFGQKEIHIAELSATSKGRSFLLSSGCMKDWHRSGWVCPNYIYQWLFEVVALEINKIGAKNALSTLFVLWSLPGSKVEAKIPHIYKQRYIQFKTFKSVLLAYDAIPSQLIEGVLSSPEEQDLIIHANNKENFDVSDCRHIPLSQLGWMVKAFSFSVRLWSRAYTYYEIRHVVRLLLQLSLDKTGFLVMQEIQVAIDNCLSAFKETDWETEVKNLSRDICDIVPSTKRQVHLLDSVKTNYGRSRHLRRVIGITCLERCLEQEVPGSIDYISTDQSLLKQIYEIFSNPKGFFINRENIDYEECWIRVAMLDAAIGIDDDEIRADKEVVLKIANELRTIGLQIGARVGVMKKTLANEMILRVWRRVTHILGPSKAFTH